MTKEQFFAVVADLDAEALRKALWTLYWRGSAPMRERIEGVLVPGAAAEQRAQRQTPPDPWTTAWEINDFVALARRGAYLAGDRRVSPRERTRWRFTFRRLAAEGQQALAGDEEGSVAEALGRLVDLACETKGTDRFRSHDPIAAAQVVVSDLVEALWTAERERLDLEAFAERAAAQLLRWESPWGWTRMGEGRVAERERPLAEVLEGLLRTPDEWSALARAYVSALEQQRGTGTGGRRRGEWPVAERLGGWHAVLSDRLRGSEDEALLDRLPRGWS